MIPDEKIFCIFLVDRAITQIKSNLHSRHSSTNKNNKKNYAQSTTAF